MGIAVAVTLCAVASLAAVIAELHGRRPSATELSRGHRAGLAFVLGVMALVVLSPQLALVFDRPLPVAPPDDPLGGAGCGDDAGDDALLFVVVLVVYVGGRAGLGILACVVRAVAAPPTRVVTGRRALMISACFVAVTFPLATARLLLPGPTPDDFRTYGALTPDAGARGWRAEHTLDARGGGPLVELRRVGRPASDTHVHECHSHACFFSGRRLATGLHAWVGDAPVLIYAQGDTLVGAPVTARDPSEVPSARRPHFQGWPQVATRSHGDGWLLVERRRDGSFFAVQTWASGQAESVYHRDVWLLVRPSEIPHGIAFALILLGLAAARASRRRGDSPGLALLAAWLWLEAGALDLFAYAPYLGL